jgi:isopenicillin-N N-acyltransferase-like protein
LKRSFVLATVFTALFLFSSFQSSKACTLWGATGRWVEGGGTLIVKNRDWVPDHHHELAILRPAEGFKSLALRAVGGAEPGVKAGVNEKGLVIISASASQVPRAERKKFQQKKGLMRHFLATCASAEDVLMHVEWMRRPVFYMVGDRKELVLIEIAPDGRRSVIRKNSGTLAHTNHYRAIDVQNLRKPGVSSTHRQARIEELLKGQRRPFAMEDFIRFSGDRNAGPDNSIWRTGGNFNRNRTLATWLILIPAFGSPQLYLKTADPGEPERICGLLVDEVLGRYDQKTIPLDSDLCKGAASKSGAASLLSP